MEESCEQKKNANKKYYCHFELTLQVIGGKWKSLVLYHLGRRNVLRFGELKKALPNISEKMLIQQLRELETDGLVHRKIFRQVPPKVEYSLTEIGVTLVPILAELRDWGIYYEKATGLSGNDKLDQS